MATLAEELIPRLSDSLAPPVVLGTAVLATASMHGADTDTLLAMIDATDADPVARLYDTAIAMQLAFRRAEGLDVQDEAMAASRLFRVRRDGAARPAIRLLALVAPGDLMVNAPLDFITNHLDVRLDLLFIRPDEPLPAVIPDHDVIFFAVSEADAAMRARMARLFAGWPRPALNDPALLPLVERDRLALLLADVPSVCSPPAVAVDRAALDRALDDGTIAAMLPGGAWPILIRPAGSHAGIGLKKLASAADLAGYLVFSFAASYVLTAFVDYRGADGMFRKYRVAFVDRAPFLCHMAVSQRWMVHYLNAGMAESADKRADEARAMARFDTGFAHRHRAAFAALHERLPFDYYSIDCSELPDGRLLVFEADTAAIIHLMDPEDLYPYKHRQMRRVFDAFGAMLRRRLDGGGDRAAA